MADLKVNDGGTAKTPERIFTVGASNTLFQVNYVIANNASQTPVTVWDAIFTTSRTTSFNTTNTTSTSFTTTFATTRDTTQTTTTSFSTSFDTSQSTTTTCATSKSTTTTFGTSKSTTTTFGTSKSTTTTFGTSRTTSRNTLGAYTAYQYSYPSNYFWSVSISVSVRWAGTTITAGFYAPGLLDTTWDFGGYRYQRGAFQQSVSSKLFTTSYYSLSRQLLSQSTSFTTSFNTSRATTTAYNTSRATTTAYNTSRSTTTTFNTSNATNTALGTSSSTSADTTTTFSTSFDTSNTTSQDTTTTFSTNRSTTVFERVTATGAETEVSSAGAHNIRHWDGSQWTES